MRVAHCAAVLAANLLLSVAANAVPVTYQYEGPTLVDWPDQPDMPPGVSHISATFTVDLAPNMLLEPGMIDIFNHPFEISDGYTTIDPTIIAIYGYQIYANFLTDAAANIVAMGLVVEIGHSSVATFQGNQRLEFVYGSLGEFSETIYCAAVSVSSCDDNRVASSESPGTLSVVASTSVPEPSTLSLLAAGLLGLATLWRRRIA